MGLIDTIKAFFKAPNVDPVTIAIHDAFTSAHDAYDVPLGAIMPFSNRAINRYAIYKWTEEQAGAYAETFAAITDPADFDQYSEAELDAHTAAMDNLTTAFDDFTATFDAFNPADIRYASAAALYEATRELYKLTAEAYSNAVFCALLTALEGQSQALKDSWKLTLLGPKATSASKTNVAENANKAKLLEGKARVAQTKAEVFLAKEAAAWKNRSTRRRG